MTRKGENMEQIRGGVKEMKSRSGAIDDCI